jgi:exodeoxyribonuclease VII small subunit
MAFHAEITETSDPENSVSPCLRGEQNAIPRLVAFSTKLPLRSSGFALQFPQQESYLPKFEECLDRLEKIVDELEKSEVPLDRALELFDEGMKLSGSCRKELEEAEGKIEILLKRDGKLQPEAFPASTQPGTPAR